MYIELKMTMKLILINAYNIKVATGGKVLMKSRGSNCSHIPRHYNNPKWPAQCATKP